MKTNKHLNSLRIYLLAGSLCLTTLDMKSQDVPALKTSSEENSIFYEDRQLKLCKCRVKNGTGSGVIPVRWWIV